MKAVNQSIDRLANTYITNIKDKGESAEDRFTEKSLTPEVIRFGEILMYKIPEDISRARSIVSLYFREDGDVETDLSEVFTELRKWHEFVSNYVIGKGDQRLPFTERVSKVPGLSLEGLDHKIKNLINTLEEEKF